MPIQILPPILANQIAAGEVVERPSSVVKELVENSLDAKATRIEIELEKGGSQLIRIRDNGTGISGDELKLSLARHATSKVATLDDLEQIASLGFRGEALASISSVSRLTITSRTQAQTEAWQAYAEGREMDVTVRPASHPVGTTVEVLDLFFNTPARRRFLRSEKTEFAHIDELIRRLALSRFDVTLTLKHNGKLLRQYKPSEGLAQQTKRVAVACGNEFAQSACWFESEHLGLKLSGWLMSKPLSNITDIQYCYVNGRMMRDKLLTHAIRQAYTESLMLENPAPAYIVYLEIDPRLVDVNVHPSKHEVRFHEARTVHDFVVSVIRNSLKQSFDQVQSEAEHEATWQVRENYTDYPVTPLKPAGQHSYYNIASNRVQRPERRELVIHDKLLQTTLSVQPEQRDAQYDAFLLEREHQFINLIQQRFVLIGEHEDLYLFDLSLLHAYQLKQRLLSQFDDGLTAQPLLIPQRILISVDQAAMTEYAIWLDRLGVQLRYFKKGIWIIQAVPALLRQTDLAVTIPALIETLLSHDSVLNSSNWAEFINVWSDSFRNEMNHFTRDQALSLWKWFVTEQPEWKNQVKFYQKIELQKFIEVFLRD